MLKTISDILDRTVLTAIKTLRMRGLPIFGVSLTYRTSWKNMLAFIFRIRSYFWRNPVHFDLISKQLICFQNKIISDIWFNICINRGYTVIIVLFYFILFKFRIIQCFTYLRLKGFLPHFILKKVFTLCIVHGAVIREYSVKTRCWL